MVVSLRKMMQGWRPFTRVSVLHCPSTFGWASNLAELGVVVDSYTIVHDTLVNNIAKGTTCECVAVSLNEPMTTRFIAEYCFCKNYRRRIVVFAVWHIYQKSNSRMVWLRRWQTNENRGHKIKVKTYYLFKRTDPPQISAPRNTVTVTVTTKRCCLLKRIRRVRRDLYQPGEWFGTLIIDCLTMNCYKIGRSEQPYSPELKVALKGNVSMLQKKFRRLWQLFFLNTISKEDYAQRLYEISKLCLERKRMYRMLNN